MHSSVFSSEPTACFLFISMYKSRCSAVSTPQFALTSPLPCSNCIDLGLIALLGHFLQTIPPKKSMDVGHRCCIVLVTKISIQINRMIRARLGTLRQLKQRQKGKRKRPKGNMFAKHRGLRVDHYVWCVEVRSLLQI